MKFLRELFAALFTVQDTQDLEGQRLLLLFVMGLALVSGLSLLFLF